MGAIALPKKYALNKANRFLCAKLGVRFNGEPLTNCHRYDVAEGYVIVKENNQFIRKEGLVEPYWRS